MSSWAVLSMMGIYSVDPASLAYELVGPTFPKAVIHLHEPYAGKTFSIESNGAAANAPFIRSVQLNGQPKQKNWISFHSIAAGGTLHFTLGSEANQAWGSAADDGPPSLSNPD
jgi:putative alpha-1,2-mannosidase